MTHQETPQERQQNLSLIAEWEQAKDLAAQWYAREVELRERIQRDVFRIDENSTQTGTLTYDLPKGYKAKLKPVVSNKVKEKELGKVRLQLLQAGVPSKTLDELFKATHRFSKTAFDKFLTPEQQELAKQAYTTKPGRPQFEIVSPKNKK